MNNLVIFGGCGFIGINYANKNLHNFDKIFLVDLNKPKNLFLINKFNKLIESTKVFFINGDIRNDLINLDINNISLIVDFAAIHREPGHREEEYFNTNVVGSNNICDFAKNRNCSNIIFTSSISVYGSGDHKKNEDTKPLPDTPYGKSKLQSENNYIKWLENDKKNRILTICRPGVVFGPGERGNVTRLVKIVKKKLFFFMGNKDLYKSGIYIDELINALIWVNTKQKDKEFNNFVLFNGSFNPCPKLDDYVMAIQETLNIKNKIFGIPKKIILRFINLTSFITKNLRSDSSLNFIRLKKLFRSNNVEPNFLIKKKYNFKFNLINSMKEWKQINKNDWF